jgi:protein-disulfide isomerase
MNEKKLFLLATVLFVLGSIAAVAIFDRSQSEDKSVLVSANVNALNRTGAPTKGPKDAKVTIVEFFDPACATCRQFHPLLEQMLIEYSGKVRVVMRYAPLHTGSDQVVKMLEAAHLQGEFWPALMFLFANQDRWVANHVSDPMRAKALLDSMNLNPEQFDSDWKGAIVARAVNQDVQDGQTLNVSATPEFFVNGRSLPSFGYEQLRQLVKEAVAEAY